MFTPIEILFLIFILPTTILATQPAHSNFRSRDEFKISQIDPNSFSNPDQVYAENYHFELKVNFQRKVLEGSVLYNLVAVDQHVDAIIFDTSNLTIKSIKEKQSGKNLDFEFGDSFLTFGQPLRVTLPPLLRSVSGQLRTEIVIEFETSPQASGLQWLTPEQTADKKAPFLFTTFVAIHARSMFPCQDTPYTKATFSASIIANENFVVLMGAISSGDPTRVVTDPSKFVHKWRQSVPISSYLIALAVGHLESRDLSSTSRVWAESKYIDDAALDLQDTPKMLQVATSLIGQYEWGRYDLLILPPAFPYGGMENPCLTFLYPGVVTGDKSLKTVVSHEIAHSWIGNLVSIKNFQHFWLKDGLTVFLERKIIELFIGGEKGARERNFEALNGLLELKQQIVVNLNETNPLTKLVTNLTGLSQDDAFSLVPYEKGSLFFFYLETLIGADLMNHFIRAYVRKFSRKSIDTKEWKNYFIKWVRKHGAGNKIQNVDWDTWLHKSGMPIIIPDYDRTLYNQCVNLRDKWVNFESRSLIGQESPFSENDIANFSQGQLIAFLQLLIDSVIPLPIPKLKLMESLYQFGKSRNIEILYRWVRCGLKKEVKWEEQVTVGLFIVSNYGRMANIRPIYRDLYALGGDVRRQAIKTFKKNIPNMMAVSIRNVMRDLHLTQNDLDDKNQNALKKKKKRVKIKSK